MGRRKRTTEMGEAMGVGSGVAMGVAMVEVVAMGRGRRRR